MPRCAWRRCHASFANPFIQPHPPAHRAPRSSPAPPFSAPACSVSWQEVWQFFISELGLVAHLRLALDDDRPAVVAAAAAALAAVVSGGCCVWGGG